MKYAVIIFSLLFSTTLLAQREWGDMEKNKLTLKEIAPVWPGCESQTGSLKDTCFKQKLATHIAKNFKYPKDSYKKNEQGRVVVEFYITEEGLVDIKKVTGGTPALQAEAKRNISLIPKMEKPGMMGGKPRAIQYIVPITFKTGR
ncbi:energy transducer TonB [Marinirhabdus gelatinilytica]|uniref:TonB family protein n=1 Tax=Marinirhabdus gelatinilytica TaxID=1703343 RepID=A0A370Q672_9FLAO|nr:energy transducer TonB [Marinirhabdus gelatinilytica]RDK83848.1 TonB family protein [Marinirhabdus gelatinilytica]